MEESIEIIILNSVVVILRSVEETVVMDTCPGVSKEKVSFCGKHSESNLKICASAFLSCKAVEKQSCQPKVICEWKGKFIGKSNVKKVFC